MAEVNLAHHLLLKDEDRHLRIIKDLYRDLTHC